MVHIFRARLWSLRNERDEVVAVYKFLADKAVEFRAEVEIADAPDAAASKLNLGNLFAKSA